MTDLPLCEPQIHLSTTFGSHSLVILERTTDDTGRNCQVAVVAVLAVSAGVGVEAEERYEMPAAFHANAIVCERSVFVIWQGLGKVTFSMQ